MAYRLLSNNSIHEQRFTMENLLVVLNAYQVDLVAEKKMNRYIFVSHGKDENGRAVSYYDAHVLCNYRAALRIGRFNGRVG